MSNPNYDGNALFDLNGEPRGPRGQSQTPQNPSIPSVNPPYPPTSFDPYVEVPNPGVGSQNPSQTYQTTSGSFPSGETFIGNQNSNNPSLGGYNATSTNFTPSVQTASYPQNVTPVNSAPPVQTTNSNYLQNPVEGSHIYYPNPSEQYDLSGSQNSNNPPIGGYNVTPTPPVQTSNFNYAPNMTPVNSASPVQTSNSSYSQNPMGGNQNYYAAQSRQYDPSRSPNPQSLSSSSGYPPDAGHQQYWNSAAGILNWMNPWGKKTEKELKKKEKEEAALEKMRQEQREKQRLHDQKIAEMMQRRLKEEELEIERDREMDRKREARKMENEKSLINMLKEQSEEEERMRKLKELEIEASHQKLEEFKRREEEKMELKELGRRKELEQLEAAGKRDLKELEISRFERKEEIEQILKDHDDNMLKNQLLHEEEMEMKNREFEKDKLTHEERMKEIKENYEKERESMWREHERLMEHWKEQWKQIETAMKYKVWNDILERNWTNRLNHLRSTNDKVNEKFKVFEKAITKLLQVSDKSEKFERQRRFVKSFIRLLLESVKFEDKIMKNELDNLRVQFDNTGKGFVYQIIEDVERVEFVLGEFQNLIEEFSSKLDTDSVQEQDLMSLRHAFEKVSHFSARISTLSELKRKHQEDMKSNSEGEDVPSASSVIIEEME